MLQIKPQHAKFCTWAAMLRFAVQHPPRELLLVKYELHNFQLENSVVREEPLQRNWHLQRTKHLGPVGGFVFRIFLETAESKEGAIFTHDKEMIYWRRVHSVGGWETKKFRVCFRAWLKTQLADESNLCRILSVIIAEHDIHCVQLLGLPGNTAYSYPYCRGLAWYHLIHCDSASGSEANISNRHNWLMSVEDSPPTPKKICNTTRRGKELCTCTAKGPTWSILVFEELVLTPYRQSGTFCCASEENISTSKLPSSILRRAAKKPKTESVTIFGTKRRRWNQKLICSASAALGGKSGKKMLEKSPSSAICETVDGYVETVRICMQGVKGMAYWKLTA
ncbi:hypothetical protein ACFE04_029095 [Oxalis oulophora]